MINYFLLIIYFILGTAFGSFVNVWSRRLLKGKSPTGRSACEHCGHVLSALDLIPLFSFIALYGRCRYCSKPLSWQYPLGEFFTGLLFAASIWLTGYDVLLSLPLLVTAVGLVAIFATDLSKQIIFDQNLAAVFIGSLLYRLFLRLPNLEYRLLFFDLIGALVFWLLLWFTRTLTKGKGMGEGDPPLAFSLGLLVGYPLIWVAVFLSFVVGGIIGAVLVLSGEREMKSRIAFGPFLILGAYLALFFGESLLFWYLKFLGA